MNKNFRNALLMLAVGAFAVSCADYNETNNFYAEPDPNVKSPYKDLATVKSYINREAYPNMSLGAALKLSEFKEQALAHAAAVANFNDYYFGTSFMSGAIINAKGVLNFIDFKEQLDHVEEVKGLVYGSAIAANTGQADGWLNLLTAPIEILVEYQEAKSVDYNTVESFSGAGGKIVKKNGENVLQVNQMAKVNIIDDFKVEPKATYTTQFWIKADKAATFNVVFSGTKVDGPVSGGRFSIEPNNEWKRISVDAQAAEGETEGYLRLETTLGSTVFIRRVQVGFLPDNHREQTDTEKKDTIRYAMRSWCDGLMKNNAGRIKSFDLIEEPLSAITLEGTDIFDLKHSTDKIFWQDYFGDDTHTGSELYAPVVSDAAITAFEKYGGNRNDLKFFICEKGLEDNKKYESLMYWIKIWEQNGAKIDGVNARVSLSYSEDATTQAANKASYEKLLDNLKKSGKLIRLSNFDIKYYAADGTAVTTEKITSDQRQKLADYYANVIKKYLTTIDAEKQAGICKGNIVDSSDPVGLWAVENKDWVRTATYKAFCDALSGK